MVEWPVARVCSATRSRSSRDTSACAGDRVRGRGRDQADVGLGLGQRGQDPQPGLGPALVGEQRRRLGRGPQVAVDGRVGRVRAARHDAQSGPGRSPGAAPQSARSAARTSSRFAPHGTTAVAPFTSMPRSSRQHLVSTRVSRPGRGPRPRAQVDPRRVRAVEVLVELPGPLAADQQPVRVLGRVRVQEADVLAGRQAAAAARQQVVRRRVGRHQLGARPPRPGSGRPAAGPRRSRPPARPWPAAWAGAAGPPR